jgi:GNAT superfamily N-acetyltransferase
MEKNDSSRKSALFSSKVTSTSTLELKNIHSPSLAFFHFLPTDWKLELFPQWPRLRNTCNVFALYETQVLQSVGIVFEHTLPKLSWLEQQARCYFSNGLYIAYFYTLPEYRNQSRARYWMDAIKKYHTHRTIWLTIEDSNLVEFYTKLGFTPFHLPSKSSTLSYNESQANDDKEFELVLYYEN